ncbi:MAG: DNA repair protein RadC [Oscillospiraceae bacterium]|nr:DNA repair protein RadC [Oscillospiraceae bacterium]
MGVHDGHRQRLKSRFLAQGLSGFEDHNILELLLFYSIPRSDTNEIAHHLLKEFKSLSGVFDAPVEELCKIKGISIHTATLIKLIPEMMSVYHTDKTKDTKIVTSTSEAGKFFIPRFYGKKNEEVHVLLLDDKKKVIRCDKLFEGTVNSTPITVKKVVAAAVNSNATGLVLAHNHPGGVALPSQRDIRATEKIYKALKLINVELCDHIIVADDDFVSLADSGEFVHFNY